MRLEKGVSEFAGMKMDCECGRTHTVPIKKIITGKGALNGLSDILADFKGKRVFLIGDQHTMPLARDRVLAMLSDAGCETSEYIFHNKRHLILNEELIGRLLIRLPEKTELLVTIGSGTLNDLSRVISARCGIPYIIIGTAPSMDGYASTVSPVVMDGGKHSVRLNVPYAIIGDTDLLVTAPDEMLSSGVGDILGKYIALNDWALAQREIGEYFCPHIAGIVNTAVNRCADGAPKIPLRDPSVIGDMMDTLILSGAAISMHGESSRPASGCEHQLAHYWEVSMLSPDRETSLHGNFVGLGTRVACRLYELASEEFDLALPFRRPSPAEIQSYMDPLGDFSSIETLGLTKPLLYESFFHATEANKRYTLVSYLTAHNRLEHYAKLITEEMFG